MVHMKRILKIRYRVAIPVGRINIIELLKGSEEAKVSDEELQAHMLAKETNRNMTQKNVEIGEFLGEGGYESIFMVKIMRIGEMVQYKSFTVMEPWWTRK